MEKTEIKTSTANIEWNGETLVIENMFDGLCEDFTKSEAIQLRNFLNQLELGE